ncbi:MAG: STAS domain-containing protein [Saccharofermentans sp.]|nr:STAS domain-containing protein [Saccharofermentans sp.]
MEIRKTVENNKLTLVLEGKLDTITSKDLEEVLVNSTDGVTELIIDLKELSFISSAGLRVLAVAQKMMKRQGRLVIHDPQPDVQEVFDMTGLSNFMEIEHNDK